ncbi:CTP synthase (glutamine hydrolyzing) [Bertholletia excelsa]
MVFSYPRHLMVARECIIIMQIVYKMDFSLLGYLMCYWALVRGKHFVTIKKGKLLQVRIAMVGKYVGLTDSYLSVVKALLHACVACSLKPSVDWVAATDLEDDSAKLVWNPQANQEGFAPSVVEVLQIIDESLDAYFRLPIPMHPALLADLMAGLDRCLQYYITKVKSRCGSRNTFIPTMPALTRCTTSTKFQGVWKKKEKPMTSQRRNSQVATLNGGILCFNFLVTIL